MSSINLKAAREALMEIVFKGSTYNEPGHWYSKLQEGCPLDEHVEPILAFFDSLEGKGGDLEAVTKERDELQAKIKEVTASLDCDVDYDSLDGALPEGEFTHASGETDTMNLLERAEWCVGRMDAAESEIERLRAQGGESAVTEADLEAFVEELFSAVGGERVDSLVITRDIPKGEFGGWGRAAILARLHGLFHILKAQPPEPQGASGAPKDLVTRKLSSYKNDDRPRKGYWAPGTYCCWCRTCRASFFGDKRAGTCADCAYLDSGTEPQGEPECEHEWFENSDGDPNVPAGFREWLECGKCGEPKTKPDCETCQDEGEIDNTLGGEAFMGTSPCPDCSEPTEGGGANV